MTTEKCDPSQGIVQTIAGQFVYHQYFKVSCPKLIQNFEKQIALGYMIKKENSYNSFVFYLYFQILIHMSYASLKMYKI